MKIYFCVGCRQVHYDNDYSKEDGDLLITNGDDFLQSVLRIKNITSIKQHDDRSKKWIKRKW